MVIHFRLTNNFAFLFGKRNNFALRCCFITSVICGLMLLLVKHVHMWIDRLKWRSHFSVSPPHPLFLLGWQILPISPIKGLLCKTAHTSVYFGTLSGPNWVQNLYTCIWVQYVQASKYCKGWGTKLIPLVFMNGCRLICIIIMEWIINFLQKVHLYSFPMQMKVASSPFIKSFLLHRFLEKLGKKNAQLCLNIYFSEW